MDSFVSMKCLKALSEESHKIPSSQNKATNAFQLKPSKQKIEKEKKNWKQRKLKLWPYRKKWTQMKGKKQDLSEACQKQREELYYRVSMYLGIVALKALKQWWPINWFSRESLNAWGRECLWKSCCYPFAQAGPQSTVSSFVISSKMETPQPPEETCASSQPPTAFSN